MAGDPRTLVDALLDQALDLPAAERPGFLALACTEPGLREQVAELLRLSEDPSHRLDPAAVRSGPLWNELFAALGPEAGLPAGTRVGPWRLIELLGRGGMGAVYAAARADGAYEQDVALKLLSDELISAEALRRFERERQILAGLDHPAIARLLDGGRTADGRPYFAMELVPGRPLDQHCDAHRLSVHERLRLFVQVCRAVEHAHRNLIVHRDLKPSNIVVTPDGRVKLLDFGIARLLAPEGGAEPVTRGVAHVLTPEYASPEQVMGQPVAIASDVYQLGVLLHELLAGRRPYEVGRGASALEIERVICHLPPSRPSAAAVAPPPGAALDAEQVAARRRTTPRALARALCGDLDTIVLHALRKEPGRRYATVNDLANDVTRHLSGWPVLARGDSLGYRAGRFLSRNRWATAAAAVVLLLLAGWALSANVQARQVARERDRARAEAAKAAQVKRFALRLFSAADPEVARGQEMTARELLEWGWAGIEKELAGQPEVQVELLVTVGDVYRQLGLYEQSDARLRAALERARELDRDHPALLATALTGYGRLQRDRGEFDHAHVLMNEALALRRLRLGDEHPDVLEVLSDLGLLANARGQYAQAADLFRRVLEVRRRLLVPDDPRLADSLAELGMTLRSLGDYAGAEPLLREALASRRRLLPEKHPQLATSLSNLALVEQSLGKPRQAEALYREALGAMIEARGESHPHVAVTLNNLARLLRAQGELEEAERLLRRALAIRQGTLAHDHPQLAMNFNDLGRVVQDRGDLDGAERLFRLALDRYPPDHPWRPASVSNLGLVREQRRDYPGAEQLYRQALAAEEVHYGAGHVRVGIDLTRLGVVLEHQGKLAEAEVSLRRALEVFRKRLPAQHTRLAEALVPLGTLLLRRGRAAEAEPLLREGLAIRREGLGVGDALTAEAARALRRALAAQGREPDVDAPPRAAQGSTSR